MKRSRSETVPALVNVVFANLGLKWLVVGWMLAAQVASTSLMIAPAKADTIIDATNSTAANPQVVTDSAEHAGNVSVGSNAPAVFDLSSSGVMNIAGNLVNAGTIYAISTNPQFTSGTINANSITIAPGATLTSILPTGGLPGFSNAISNFSFILNATNINNAGTISSANNLAILASDSVINTGLIAAQGNLSITAGSSIANIMNAAGMAGVMQAVNNVALTAPNIINNSQITANTGNLNLITNLLQNSGVIQSIVSNVSIQSLNSAVLKVANDHGTIEALNSIVNVSNSKGQDIDITGGSITAREINFKADYGRVDVIADTLTGTVNAEAGRAYIGAASSPNLTLGNLTLSSDPIFFNNGGKIDVTGTINTGGGDLGIFASGDITLNAAVGAVILNTASAAGGGDIWLVAGATTTKLDNPPFGGTGNVAPVASAPDGTYQVTLTGSGSISLSNGSNVIAGTQSIDARGTAGNSNGGNLTMIAGGAGGRVSVGTDISRGINTSGSGAGVNGSVLVIAGGIPAPGVPVIELQNITTTGGSGGGGNVTLYASTPVTAPVTGVTFVLSGGGTTITTADSFTPTGGFGAPVINATTMISTGSISSAGAVIVSAGSTIAVNGALSAATTAQLSSLSGDVQINNAVATGGNTTITAGGKITIAGGVTANQFNAIGSTVSVNNNVTANGGINITSSGNITQSNSISITNAIGVGSQPYGIAVNPSGSRAYVSNNSGNSVAVVDTGTRNVVATVPVGNGPINVAVNPAGSFVYVANHDSNNVSVIDTTTNTVSATVGVGTGPTGVAVTPNGAYVYVTNDTTNNVSVIDTATNTVVATIPVGNAPDTVAFDPSGSRAYVSNFNSSTVSVIDTGTNTVISTVPVGLNPTGLAVNPAGTFVYVANRFGNSVSVIDTGSNTVSNTISVNTRPNGVAFNSAGDKVFITSRVTETVSTIDTATNTVIGSVLVGTIPLGIAVNPSSQAIYAVNNGSDNVTELAPVDGLLSSTGSVVLFSTAGSIGSFVAPLKTQAGTLVATAAAANQDIVIRHQGSSTLNLGAITAGGQINIETAGSGNFNINGLISAGTDMVLGTTGKISFQSGRVETKTGHLILAASQLLQNGADIDITAGKNVELYLSDTISIDARTATSAKNVSIVGGQSGLGTLIIQNLVINADGNGAGNGGDVTVFNGAGGLDKGAGLTVSANGGVSGKGGNLKVRVNEAPAMVIDASYILSADGGTASGDAGSIKLENPGSNGLTIASIAGLSADSTNGTSGTVMFTAQNGPITFTNNINLTQTPLVSGNGGTIELLSQTLATGGFNVTLDATGKGGNAGKVWVTTNNSAANISLGTNFKVIANGPTGNLRVQAGGVLSVDGVVNTAAGMVNLVGLGNLNVNADVTTGGTLYASSGNSKVITINPAVTFSAPTIGIATPTLTNNGTISATAGNLDIDSNAPAGDLTLVLAAGSSLSAAGAGSDVRFQANFPGSITAPSGQGNISAADTVVFNGSSSAVAVDVNSITGTVTASGNPVTITTNAGALNASTVLSTGSLSLNAKGGALTLAGFSAAATAAVLTAKGDVALNANITAGTVLNITTGSTAADDLTVAGGVTASGKSVILDTPHVINNGAITATAGNVAIQSHGAGNALILDLNAGSTLSALGAGSDITLNALVAGAVTAGSAATGSISAADLITANGGGNIVGFFANTISGTVTATGTSVGVIATASDLTIGAITSSASTTISATTGAITVAGAQNITSAYGLAAAKTVTINGTVNASTSVISGDNVVINANTTLALAGNIGSANSAGNKITIGGAATLSVPALLLTTPELDNSGKISASGLTVQGSGAGNALALTLASGSKITSTGSISFNSTTAGPITAASGNGDLSAATTVLFNGGAGAVAVSVNSITGTVLANGNPVSITTAAGSLATGAVSSSSSLALTANGGSLSLGGVTSAGSSLNLAAANDVSINAVTTAATTAIITAADDINFNANTSAGTTFSITSGTSGTDNVLLGLGVVVSGSSVNLTTPSLLNNGTVSASAGNLAVQSNGAGNALSLSLGAGSAMSAAGAGSDITFNASGTGSITAASGNGSLSSADTIVFNGTTNAVNVSAFQIAGTITGSGAPFSVTSGTSNVFLGSITSTAPLTFTTNTAGSLTVVASSTISAPDVNINTPTLNNNGTIDATTGNLRVQSNLPGNALVVNLASGSVLTASGAGGDINFNPNAGGGAITISNGSFFGNISANDTVDFNGGAAAVSVAVNSINGVITANGTPVSIATAAGNMLAGPLSSGGSLVLNANGGSLTLDGVTTAATSAILSSANNFDLHANLTAGTAVSIATGAGATSTFNPGVTLAGSVVNITTGTVVNGGTISSTNGNLAFQSNAGTNALALNLGAGSVLSSAGAGADITFNASTAGSVTAAGGLGDINSSDTVVFNGNTAAISVDVNSITGTILATGAPISITTTAKNITTGAVTSGSALALTASAGTITMGAASSAVNTVNLNAANDITLNANVTAGTTLTATTGTIDTLTIAGGTTTSGTTVVLNTPKLVENGTVSATGNLTVQSNGAGNSLSLTLGAGSVLTANNVNLNTSTAGSITTASSSTGDITATNTVTFNGGAGAVNINVNAVNGTILANGNPVSIATASSTNGITGGLITSGGNIGLTANAGINLTNNVTATGALTLVSGTSAAITVQGGTTASGASATLSTPTLNNSGTISASTGNLAIQSNNGANSLTVNLSSGSVLSATGAGADINFNPAAGAVTMSSGFGDITANDTVNFNGGTNAVSVSVNSITGTVNATGNPVSIVTATGNLQTNSVSSTGSLVLNANGVLTLNGSTSASTTASVTSANNVNVNANVTSGTVLTLTSGAGATATIAGGATVSGTAVNLTTGTLANNGTVSATNGNLALQGNAAGNALTLNSGAGSVLSSAGVGADVTFNASAAGSITAAGGMGDITASDTVNFNGNTAAVSVNVNSITGTIVATGNPVSITTNSNNLNTGAINSGGALALTAAGGTVTVGGATGATTTINLSAATNVTLNANVTAGTTVTATSGATNSISVAGGTTTSGSSVVLNTPNLQNSGTISTTGGDLSVQSNGAGNGLSLSLGAGSALSGNNVTFNSTSAGSINTITNTTGNINATNTVNFNGGAGAVTIDVNAINGTITATGNPVSITTASTTNGITGGAITSGSNVVLDSKAGINLTNTVTGTGAVTLTSGNTSSVTVQGGVTVSGGSTSVITPTLNNSGTIESTAGNLLIQSNGAGSALTVNLGAGSTLEALAPGFGIQFNPSFAGSINLPSGNGDLLSNQPILFNTGGANLVIDVNSLSGTLSGTYGNFNLQVSGSVQIGTITTTTGQLSVVSSAGAVTLTAGSTLTSNQSLVLTGATGLSIGTGSTLTAGSLSVGAPLTGTLTNADIQQAGAIVLTSNAFVDVDSSLATPTSFTSNGGDIRLTALGGNLTLSDKVPGGGGISFGAHGGNIQVLASGTITAGGTNNNFLARSAGIMSAFSGGGIEFGSGMTSSTALSAYFASQAPNFTAPLPSALGANVVIIPNGGSGLIQDNVSGGGYLNVGGPTPLNPTQISLFSGALLFHSIGAAASIDMDPNFTTFSFNFGAAPPPPPPGPPAPVVPPVAAAVVIAPAVAAPLVVGAVVAADTKGSVTTSKTILSTDTISVQTDTPLPQSTRSASVPLASMESSEYLVTTNSCTGLSLTGGGDASAESGTVIHNDKENGLDLAEGKLLISASKRTVTLNTAQGRVQIPSSGVAIVEQTKSKVVRVANLGNNSTQLTMLHNGKTYDVQLGRGECIAIADEDVDEEELIPTDGVDREPLNANLTVNSKRILKHKFNMEQMARISLIAGCRTDELSLNQKRTTDNRKSSLPQTNLKSLADENTGDENTGERSHLKSVAYAASAPTAAARQLDVLSSGSLLVKKSESVDCTLERDHLLNLRSGEVFVAAKRAAVVRTPNSSVMLKPGCMALVTVKDGVVSVRALHTDADKIHINIQGQEVPLSVGQEFVAAPVNGRDTITSVLDDNVARRRCVYFNHNPIHFALSEYSLVSLMTESRTLNQLINGAGKDQMSSRIIKSAVAFSMATAAHGPFKNIGE